MVKTLLLSIGLFCATACTIYREDEERPRCGDSFDRCDGHGGGGGGGGGSTRGCGNGVIDRGEVCDDGNRQSGDGCSAECRSIEACGNGIVDVEAGEVCDDGNVQAGDGCSQTCRSTEVCGNGVVDPGEDCDDANTEDKDLCRFEIVIDEGLL